MIAGALTLAVRTYECGPCGHTEDRDVNAAKNILLVGLALHEPGGFLPGVPGGDAGASGEQRGVKPRAGIGLRHRTV